MALIVTARSYDARIGVHITSVMAPAGADKGRATVVTADLDPAAVDDQQESPAPDDEDVDLRRRRRQALAEVLEEG